MCILKLGILGEMLLIKQFEEVIWNPKIRAMEIIWFKSARLSIFPKSQTVSRNISKCNFWSRCNQSLTLNLKAPFILFSGEADGEEHETDKVLEKAGMLSTMLK